MATTLAPVAPPSEPVTIAASDLGPIQERYERGLYMQAYDLAEKLGPLKDWTGTPARILAGRLGGCVGGIKLSFWHFIKAWRADPTDVDACWFYVRSRLDTRGPWTALKIVQRLGDLDDAPPVKRAQWLAQHAGILGRLRDFDAADRLIAQAESLGIDHPWVHCERAGLLIIEDRLEEALAAARRSLELRPWYRPGVQSAAHLLVQLERDTEALELLTEACGRIESSHVWAQLAFLQIELKKYAEARRSIEEFARLSPLLEKEGVQWLAARRSDVAYFCGDLPQSVERAKEAGGPFFERMAERLANPASEGKRVQLPVPFVRQHYHTCVPATLAALSRYWSMPADHLEVAAAICYDGTPHHSERRWAEEHGWIAREFTVTWESAVALLDRGIPFSLTTMDPGNAHLQAVIGYDSFRGTLLIRDPGERHQSEFLADAFFDRYRSVGPRGMAIVPAQSSFSVRAALQSQNAQPADLALPDAEHYDHMFRLQQALQSHRRQDAEDACKTMKEFAENHYLTWLARRSLAQYDADVPGMLACAEGMLAMYPEDISWLLSKVTCLRQLARRDERITILKNLAERKPTDALCWQQYAQELAADAREHPTSTHLLRIAMRGNPYNPGTYSILARIRWDQRRFDEGLELDHYAACLGDKDEGLAQNYFTSARCQGKTEQTLDFLRRRFERYGSKSSLPARTLSWAYGQLERVHEALDILNEAIRQRPDDGELLVYAAEAQANFGYFERAQAFLKRADGKSQRTYWLRTSATVAGHLGDRQRSLGLWQQVLQADPLHLEAHRSVAQLLAETTGRAAALEHMKQACERFPRHTTLIKMRIEWLREDGPAAVEPVVRNLNDIHGADAWARRELALNLADQRRFPEALAEMALAEGLEPHSAVTAAVRGRLLYLSGRYEESKEANRQAIRLSADHDLAIRELIASCDSLAQRREVLAFVEQELIRQVIFGDGLLTFRDLALYTLQPEELLASLQKALDARPDLWHAWSAVIRQLTDMQRLDDALVVARQAVDRFPLLPALCLDLAFVYRQAKEPEGEIETLQKALEINPGWAPALRQLAEAYEHKGKLEQARELLERAVTRAPLVSMNHGSLADILWKMDRKEEALDRVRQALRLDPGYEWAWGRLQDWSRKLEKPEVSLHVARDLAERRPGEARSWLMLARTLLSNPPAFTPNNGSTTSPRAECLAALDRAIALNPRLGDAFDIKAEVLTQDRRFDEALAACNPDAWAGQAPLQLRARAAWVVAQQGNLAEAVTRIRAVLAEDANYYWAWMQLADWSQATSNFEEYLKAAENLVRLLPNGPVPLGYRGEARIRMGQRQAGKVDLKRALELSPDYGFAGMILFDEQLADNELDQAGNTMEVLKDRVGGAFVEAREVQLWAKRGDKRVATRAFSQLCESPESNPWPLDAAHRAMMQAGWEKRADRVFRRVVRQPKFNPNVAALWAERCPGPDHLEERLRALERALPQATDRYRFLDLQAELLTRLGRFDQAMSVCNPVREAVPLFLKGRAAWVENERGRSRQAIQQMTQIVAEDPNYFWGWQQLTQWHLAAKQYDAMTRAARSLLEMGPGGLSIVAGLAESLSKQRQSQALRGLVARCGDLLRCDTITWGQIGSAFGGVNDDRSLAEWMHDWAEHQDAQPWMLINLAIALRGIDRQDEARKVSLHAQTLEPDYTILFHNAWLCLDDALAENWTDLEERLAEMEMDKLDPFHAFVAALMNAVRSVSEASPGERPRVFEIERRRLAQAAAESKPVLMERALDVAYRQSVTRLAELRGGLAAKLWCMWRCWQPLLPRAQKVGTD